MAPNKAYMITLAAILLLNSGCSGGRLRNLISRSDYQSLDELDLQDDDFGDRYGNDSAIDRAQNTSRTVSQQRELLDDEKPSRFSITRMLKRKKPDADFGEDPFLSPEIAEPAAAQAREFAEQSETQAQSINDIATETVASTADQFSNTLSDVEKQAEDMFDDLSNATSTASSSNPFGELKKPTEGATEETSSVVTHSFAEFMEKRAERKMVAEPDPEPQFEVIPKESPAQQFAFNPEPEEEKEEGFDFDSLVSDSKSEQPTTSETPASELFPELETMFSEQDSSDKTAAFESPKPPAATFAFDQNIEKPQTASVDTTRDQYSMASEKHGFGPLGKQDPWAAFDSDSGSGHDEVSWADSSQKKEEAAGFNWGQTPVSDHENTTKQSAPPADSPFMQVASTQTSHDFGQETESNTGALVIPVPAQLTESDSGLTIPEPGPAPTADDFFGSAEDFELAEVPLDEVDQTEDSGTTGGFAAITSWPTRTWFFLLGCILVAVLLFLPNRQKQDN